MNSAVTQIIDRSGQGLTPETVAPFVAGILNYTATAPWIQTNVVVAPGATGGPLTIQIRIYDSDRTTYVDDPEGVFTVPISTPGTFLYTYIGDPVNFAVLAWPAIRTINPDSKPEPIPSCKFLGAVVNDGNGQEFVIESPNQSTGWSTSSPRYSGYLVGFSTSLYARFGW